MIPTSTFIFFHPLIVGGPQALAATPSIQLSNSSPALNVRAGLVGATTVSFLSVGDMTHPIALNAGSSIAIESSALAALANIKPIGGSTSFAIANGTGDLESGISVAAVFDINIVADAVVDLEVHGPLLSDATISIDNPSPVLARTIGLSGDVAIAIDSTGVVGGSVDLRGELTSIAISGWGAFGFVLESYTTSITLTPNSPTLRNKAALFGNLVDSPSTNNIQIATNVSADLALVTNSLSGVVTIDVINGANMGTAIKLSGRADVAIICSAALSVALHNSARFFFREQILQLG